MSQEIVYTSAPQGLKPGSKGFCTVVSTAGMAGNFSERLEMLSGYRHAFTPGDRHAPVNYSHLHIKISGQPYYVLSRVCDAGLDYSQRSNKLAHHVALSADELVAAGPAAVLAQRGFCESRWDGTVKTLPVGRRPNVPHSRPGVCSAWKNLTGDAGWAGVLAHSATEARPKPVTVIFPAGTDTLTLLVEALNLLSPGLRWNVTFSTYFTKAIAGSDCLWRCVLDGTKQAGALRKNPNSVVIDLSANLKAPPDTPFLSAARTGRPGPGYNDDFAAPSPGGSSSYRTMRARKKPQVNPVAEHDEFAAANAAAGSWDQYRNMPAMPDLPPRRRRWLQRKSTWFLLGFLLLSVTGGLIAAAYHAGQKAPPGLDPKVGSPAAPDSDPNTGANSADGSESVTETTSEPALNNTAEPGSATRPSAEDRGRAAAESHSLTPREVSILPQLGGRDRSKARVASVDPFAELAADKLPNGVIPLFPPETGNTVRKPLPLSDVTRCELEILPADKSVAQSLDFSEKDPGSDGLPTKTTRTWTAKMRGPGGGRAMDLGTFHIDGSHLVYEQTARPSEPRLARFSYSLLKITVDHHSEYFTLREPQYLTARPIQLTAQSKTNPVVFRLPHEIAEPLVDALRFDVTHTSVDGFTANSLRSGDQFVVTFGSDGEAAVRTGSGDRIVSEGPDSDVLAVLQCSIAYVDNTEVTESTEPPEHSGAFVVSVEPSVYLRLLDTSDAAEFGARFLTGDPGLIQPTQSVNWDIASISSQLSTENVIRTIRVRVGKEFADKVKFGSKLDPQADHFLSTLPNDVDRYYGAVLRGNANRQKHREGMEMLIRTVESHKNVLAVLTDLTGRLQESNLQLRAYTLIDGQVVDVFATKANQ